MKRNAAYFLAGVLAIVLLLTVSVSALATDGSFTITVHPIRILVDGEPFQPTDAAGRSVTCFTINGCTYAPLRALAEAYGLEVGYDPAANMATVNHPGQTEAPAASSADLRELWTVAEKPVTNYGNERIYTATYNGDLSMQGFKTWWKSLDQAQLADAAEALAAEAQSANPDCKVTMYFSFGPYMLGTAWAFGGSEESNFKPASAWID